jgi:tetratricopeptide (TPR) repeat protein
MAQIRRPRVLGDVALLLAVLVPLQWVLAGELSPEDHVKRGVEAARQQRFEDAATAFQQALQLKPDDVETLAKLGFVYIELKNFQEAQRTLKRALALNPRYALGHLALGRIYYSGQAYALAAVEFQQTLSLDPQQQGVQRVVDLLQTNANDDFERVESFEAANRTVQAYRNRKELSASKGGIFHEYEFIVFDAAGLYSHSYALTSHQMSGGTGASYFLDRLEPPRQQALVNRYGEDKPPYPAVKEAVVNALKTAAQ